MTAIIQKYSQLLHAAIALVTALCLACPAARAELVVVVSARSAATALSAEQASDIFLGRITYLPGAGSVAPLDQREGVAAREAFYRKITGKNAIELKAYWSRQVFAGKGRPPKNAVNDAGVKTMVAANMALIGYIDKSALDASVKPLLTVK
ncbi:MAG: phosphate ABC transporter substrate-binding protein [Pseudomonadota bacterium]